MNFHIKRDTTREGAIRRVSFPIALLLLGTFSTACMTGARVISGFGDLRYADGRLRSDGPHSGIDIAWLPGHPIIATADGDIVVLIEDHGDCGNLIIIQHDSEYRSVYCHVDVPFKKTYGPLKRGEVIADPHALPMSLRHRGPARGEDEVNDTESARPVNASGLRLSHAPAPALGRARHRWRLSVYIPLYVRVDVRGLHDQRGNSRQSGVVC
jgi:Peptidase family M23